MQQEILFSHSTGVQTILTGRSKSTENLTLKFLFDLSKNTVNFELKQNVTIVTYQLPRLNI